MAAGNDNIKYTFRGIITPEIGQSMLDFNRNYTTTFNQIEEYIRNQTPYMNVIVNVTPGSADGPEASYAVVPVPQLDGSLRYFNQRGVDITNEVYLDSDVKKIVAGYRTVRKLVPLAGFEPASSGI